MVAIVAALELTNTTHFFHKGPKKLPTFPISTPTTGSASTNNQKGQIAATSQTTSNTQTQPENNKDSTGSSNQSVTLVEPSGNFVSNHHPNIGGSPAPNTITSVCTTTPGASCQIIFTKDSLTKSLPSQITDKGGSTYWNNWNINSVGLTAGSWQVKAVATMNNQTKSATDPMQLVVAP